MTLRISRLVTLLALSVAFAGTAQAQHGRVHLGPRVSYHFDAEKAGLGVQLGAPIARQLEFYPSFDYFLVENGTIWNLNADLKYRVPAESIEWLYFGGGLNIAHRSFGNADNTNAGLNVLIGAESRRGQVHPFGEFRFTVNDGNSSGQFAVGLNFTLR